MANYCFAEDRRTLFAEACMRGWLAGILDFPHLKEQEKITTAAQSIPDELRSSVCCISDDDYPYRHLVVTAWVISYQAFVRDVSEREKVVMASVLKGMLADEALAFLRPDFVTGDAQDAVNEAYARYQATLPS